MTKTEDHRDASALIDELCARQKITDLLYAYAWHFDRNEPDAIGALRRFAGVKRRLEVVAEVGGVTVYDDFAHHPTAIRTTVRKPP